MPKPMKFEEFTGTARAVEYDQNGTPDEWDNESTVRAHKVTEETAGRVVNTRTGNHRTQRGDVLVETDRPDVYDVLTEDQWRETDYSSAKDSEPENGSRERSVDLSEVEPKDSDRDPAENPDTGTVRRLPGDDT